MPRTAVVDRPDFHAWRAYRAVVDAETSAEQTAAFEFVPEGPRPGRGVDPRRPVPRDPDRGRLHHPVGGRRPENRGGQEEVQLQRGRRCRRDQRDREPGAAGCHRARVARSRCGAAVWPVDRASGAACGRGGANSPAFEPEPAACTAAVLPLTPQAPDRSRIRTGDNLGVPHQIGTPGFRTPDRTNIAA